MTEMTGFFLMHPHLKVEGLGFRMQPLSYKWLLNLSACITVSRLNHDGRNTPRVVPPTAAARTGPVPVEFYTRV